VPDGTWHSRGKPARSSRQDPRTRLRQGAASPERAPRPRSRPLLPTSPSPNYSPVRGGGPESFGRRHRWSGRAPRRPLPLEKEPTARLPATTPPRNSYRPGPARQLLPEGGTAPPLGPAPAKHGESGPGPARPGLLGREERPEGKRRYALSGLRVCQPRSSAAPETHRGAAAWESGAGPGEERRQRDPLRASRTSVSHLSVAQLWFRLGGADLQPASAREKAARRARPRR